MFTKHNNLENAHIIVKGRRSEICDKKKILIGECKWTSGENAAALENELRWKAAMLPFAKGKELVPVIFAKNATNQTDTAIVVTPEGIMDLMK